MKPSIAPTQTTLALRATATTADAGESEGQLTAELTFAPIDSGGKGYVHQGDTEQICDDVFVSIHSDENRRMTCNEFTVWNAAFSKIAAAESKSVADVTAAKIVFAFGDRKGDGEFSVPARPLNQSPNKPAHGD